MDIKPEDIHIGDRVVLKESAKEFLPSQEDIDTESFEILLVDNSRDNCEILLSVSAAGWRLDRYSFDNIPGQEEQIEKLRSSKGLFGWWMQITKIERVIGGNSSVHTKQPGVYDPMTSRVKSKEELSQYQKDVNFFFRDLTVPYKAPEDAWAKWS